MSGYAKGGGFCKIVSNLGKRYPDSHASQTTAETMVPSSVLSLHLYKYSSDKIRGVCRNLSGQGVGLCTYQGRKQEFVRPRGGALHITSYFRTHRDLNPI